MSRYPTLSRLTPICPLLTAPGAFLLYLRTLAPDVYVSDFAEFQYLPTRLGLPHPNGFPLYMLLGWAWSHVPLGTLAWRMNLLSAVAAALAVGLTTGFARRLSGRTSVGVLAGGLLALTPTFWGYSLVAERYTLNLALLIAALWLTWEAGRRGTHQRIGESARDASAHQRISESTNRQSAMRPFAHHRFHGFHGLRRFAAHPIHAIRDICVICGFAIRHSLTANCYLLSAVLLSLGLAVHPSDALLVPFWLAYLVWRVPALRRSLRPWVAMAGAAALPLLLYAYVPWRWAAFADWPLLPGIGRSAAVYRGLVHVWYEPPLRWDLVWSYITGLGGYATGLLTGGWREALALVAELIPLWRAEIPWPLALLALVGALRLLRRDSALALTLFAFAAFLTLMVAYIRQGKNDAYLVPAFWVVLFATAFALDIECHVSGVRCHVLRVMGYVFVAMVLAVLLFRRYPDRDLSRATEVRRWWEFTLETHPIEENAALLGHWGDLTPLWYLQQAEGRRPDLWGLFPPDIDRVIRPWLETGNPLYLTAPLHGWAPDLPRRYTLIPWGRFIRVLPPGHTLPCPLPPPQSPISSLQSPISITALVLDTRLTPGTGDVFPTDTSPLGQPSPPPPDPQPETWNLKPQNSNAKSGSESANSPFPTRNPKSQIPNPRPASLRFCWTAAEPLPRDTFVALHLRPSPDAAALTVNEPLVIPWYPLATLPAGTQGLAIIPLRLPPGTPPGTYALTFTLFRLHPDGRSEPFPGLEPVPLGDITVTPTVEFTRAVLADETAPLLPPRAGPLTLRAWRLSRVPVRPGDPVQLDLVWEVRERPTAPLALQVRFWGRGTRDLLTPPQPLLPHLEPPSWRPEIILRTSHTLRAPRGLGDHTYLVEPRLLVGERRAPWFPTGRLLVGAVRVKDRPHLWTPPVGITPAAASFGSLAQLTGYTLTPSEPRPGQTLTLTLYWQARAEVDTPYKVFVHLVDAKGRIVAQHDSPPANGTLPTDLWVPDEIVPDPHPLPLPPDLPPGRYTLRVGLYNPATGQRLPVRAGPATRDNALYLLSLSVPP